MLLTISVGKIPLTLATPAVLATFAYLDAKFHIKSDWDLIYNFTKITFWGRAQERKDRLNTFYALEEFALDKKHATRTFLKFKGQSWTYRQAYELILKYGTWIKQKYGVKKNEVVAMDFMNGDTFIWVWFGLWSIGAKPAFINYNLTNKPLIHTIKTSTARYCFAGPQFKTEKYEGDVLNELSGQNFREEGGPVEVVFFDDKVKAEIDATKPIRAPDSERSGQELKGMAGLIYTSGTTGKSLY
jgi:acyl-CoA synthetase (AMP-forming)/AMP-acid ligase II